jgi:hypothetical protein
MESPHSAARGCARRIAAPIMIPSARQAVCAYALGAMFPRRANPRALKTPRDRPRIAMRDDRTSVRPDQPQPFPEVPEANRDLP